MIASLIHFIEEILYLNGFYERKNLITLFDNINFKRRYYFDNKPNEWFIFTDLFLSLPKRKYFDPFVWSQTCDESNSYSKTGKIISNIISKKRIKEIGHIDRYKLINSQIRASIDNNLLNDTVWLNKRNYFYGDYVKRIKNFPRSHWFIFTPQTKVEFAMDGFIFSQALNNLTTTKYKDAYDALNDYVKNNNKDDFIRICNEFLDLNMDRKKRENKRDYN